MPAPVFVGITCGGFTTDFVSAAFVVVVVLVVVGHRFRGCHFLGLLVKVRCIITVEIYDGISVRV